MMYGYYLYSEQREQEQSTYAVKAKAYASYKDTKKERRRAIRYVHAYQDI